MNPADNLDDELKDAPFLKSLSNQNPFKVPEGYFENLPSVIESRIAEEKKVKVVSLFRKILQPKYAAAACLFAFALAAGVLYFNRNAQTSVNETLLSYDDLSASVYFNDIDEQLLVEELTTFDASSDNALVEFENYLLENTNDFNSLENEL